MDFKPGWEYTWVIPEGEYLSLQRKGDGTFWLILHQIELAQVTEEMATLLIEANERSGRVRSKHNITSPS